MWGGKHYGISERFTDAPQNGLSCLMMRKPPARIEVAAQDGKGGGDHKCPPPLLAPSPIPSRLPSSFPAFTSSALGFPFFTQILSLYRCKYQNPSRYSCSCSPLLARPFLGSLLALRVWLVWPHHAPFILLNAYSAVTDRCPIFSQEP